MNKYNNKKLFYYELPIELKIYYPDYQINDILQFSCKCNKKNDDENKKLFGETFVVWKCAHQTIENNCNRFLLKITILRGKYKDEIISIEEIKNDNKEYEKCNCCDICNNL